MLIRFFNMAQHVEQGLAQSLGRCLENADLIRFRLFYRLLQSLSQRNGPQPLRQYHYWGKNTPLDKVFQIESDQEKY